MKILLVSPRGFCAGVNMAIEALERAITTFGTPLYVFHEIVHNRHVVEGFRRKGVVFVDAVDEVPPGSHLMYSAHGISPAVEREARERQLRIIDATCPLVRKVHLEAVRFARLGYSIRIECIDPTASGLSGLVPTLILAFPIWRYMVRGLTSGALR